MAALPEILDEIEMLETDLEPGAETLWLSYGSTAGAMREAVAEARGQGERVSAVTVQSLWPVPERALRSALADVERVVVAGLNLGQYGREIERIASGKKVEGLNRVDGELISPGEFRESLP